MTKTTSHIVRTQMANAMVDMVERAKTNKRATGHVGARIVTNLFRGVGVRGYIRNRIAG